MISAELLQLQQQIINVQQHLYAMGMSNAYGITPEERVRRDLAYATAHARLDLLNEQYRAAVKAEAQRLNAAAAAIVNTGDQTVSPADLDPTRNSFCVSPGPTEWFGKPTGGSKP